MMQRTANENAACENDPTFTGSIFVCGPLHHHVSLSSIFWGRWSFQIRYAAHFKHGLAMIFLRGSLCLSAVTLSRQQHDILDFSNCPLSRVLHVTLANIWIWVSSEVITILVSIWMSVDQLILYRLLHRADKTQQGRNSCPRLQFLAFSLDSIMSLPR